MAAPAGYSRRNKKEQAFKIFSKELGCTGLIHVHAQELFDSSSPSRDMDLSESQEIEG
jgi:hypothetical protein